jgi:hypothetical protein
VIWNGWILVKMKRVSNHKWLKHLARSLLVGEDEIDSALGVVHREDFLPSLIKNNHMPVVFKNYERTFIRS